MDGDIGAGRIRDDEWERGEPSGERAAEELAQTCERLLADRAGRRNLTLSVGHHARPVSGVPTQGVHDRGVGILGRRLTAHSLHLRLTAGVGKERFPIRDPAGVKRPASGVARPAEIASSSDAAQ